MEAKFLGSALDSFPEFKDKEGNLFPEIVICGRSNVGKSSLINHLLGHKNLARVSSTPGKTQTINFFLVDGRFILVDLPGYGFAKRSKETKALWGSYIDAYFQKRKNLKLVLLLIDSRRKPSSDDDALASWTRHFQKPLLIIFTKSDTLAEREREKNSQEALKTLDCSNSIYYTIKDSSSRKALFTKIEENLY